MSSTSAPELRGAGRDTGDIISVNPVDTRPPPSKKGQAIRSTTGEKQSPPVKMTRAKIWSPLVEDLFRVQVVLMSAYKLTITDSAYLYYHIFPCLVRGISRRCRV